MFDFILRLIRSPDFQMIYGRGIQFASQLALVLVLPKVLFPDLYAQFNLLIPLAALGVSFVFGWLTGALNRHVYELHDLEDPRVRQSALIYYGVASALLLVTFLVLSIFTSSVYRLIPLLLISFGLKDAILIILNMSSNHRGYLFANLGFALSLVVFILLSAFSPQDDFERNLIVYGLLDATLAVIGWYLVGVVSFKPVPRLDTKIAARYFQYGFPLVIRGLPNWIMSVSDRYFLAMWSTTEILAGYIVTYQLAGSIIAIPMSFVMLILFPKIVRIDKEQGEAAALAFTYKMLRYYLRYMAAIIILATVVVTSVKYYVYPEYNFNPLTPFILVVAHVIQGLVHFYNKEFELNGKTMVIAKAMVSGAVVNLALNFILIPYYSNVGAALSTLAAYSLVVFMVYRARQYRPSYLP